MPTLRLALRRLAQTPWSTAVVLLSLALGVGANLAIFATLGALLHPRLPIADAERVVSLHSTAPGDLAAENQPPSFFGISLPDFEDFRERSGSVGQWAAIRTTGITLAGGEAPELLRGQLVSASYFDLLGVEPAHGRGFRPEEDSVAGSVVVLGHDLWRRAFAQRPDLVGQTVRLNDHPFTVVGIAPPGFRGTLLQRPAELWVPLGDRDRVLSGVETEWIDQRGGLLFTGLGRLTPGARREDAEAEAGRIAADLAREHPDDNPGRGAALLPVAEAALRFEDRARFRRAGRGLLVASLLVLAVAVANVSSLLLARLEDRRRELALRLALGAGRRRLAREMSVEALLLTGSGLALGVFVAAGLWRLLAHIRPPALPHELSLDLDPSFAAFAIALAAGISLVCGLAPLAHAGRRRLTPLLGAVRGGGERTRSGLSASLVGGQVALSVIVLATAALVLADLDGLRRADPGYRPDGLILGSLNLDSRGYDEARGAQLQTSLQEELASVPGVEAAALAQRGPNVSIGRVRNTVSPAEHPDTPEHQTLVGLNRVTPEYLATVGGQLAAGRWLTSQDRAGAPPVVVINQAMARAVFGTEPAVGRRLRLTDGAEFLTVVGVMADARLESPDEPASPYAFLPLAQGYTPWITFVARAAGDPAALVPDLRAVVRRLDPGLALYNLHTLDELRHDALWAQRTSGRLLAAYGLLVLGLSLLGLYALTARQVARRRRELAVRAAHGASRRRLLGLVLRRAVSLVALGAALGSAAVVALVAAGSMPVAASGELPVCAALATAALLTASGALATLSPALRASRTDPVQALRE